MNVRSAWYAPAKRYLVACFKGRLGMDCLTQPFMLKVDLSNYEGREQAFVKHYLLEHYLPGWAYKVGSKWGSLVYVDGFAGPWESKDPNYADTSFRIAVNALRSAKAGLSTKQVKLSFGSILVEKEKDRFQEQIGRAHV